MPSSSPFGLCILKFSSWNNPDKLSTAIELIEQYTDKNADKIYKEFHKADILATWADISKAKRLLDWEPTVSQAEGISRSVEWAKENWEWVSTLTL